jgi:hypothetical protein
VSISAQQQGGQRLFHAWREIDIKAKV